MLFMIGIETPANDQQAYGIVAPVFDKIGYGCFAAADEETEVLTQAKLAILDMAEEAFNDGHILSALDVGYKDYTKAYKDFDKWIAIDVPVETIRAKQKRINITMSEFQLSRVDAFVSSHPNFSDRSDFLAQASEKMMEAG
ncbi:MAG: hypothetical protein COB83_08935 [Gammaproteobacteria bacterium]|nr:MAG: hypothetical protein COB83_08935 [Gammaproteobacteria bacterium]